MTYENRPAWIEWLGLAAVIGLVSWVLLTIVGK